MRKKRLKYGCCQQYRDGLTSINIKQLNAEFNGWSELLNLLRTAFAYQQARIDPPSSLQQLNAETIMHKAQQETVFLAYQNTQLVACVFVKNLQRALYVGKLAVLPAAQGQGIGLQMIKVVEEHAINNNCRCLELQVRIELQENQAIFSNMGFIKVAETRHIGYQRATSITMQKILS
ncbi:MAG: hypothetical protein OFPII_43730 [Osedax symbiont Rs1]|nr:MAG: hypothetical protein OFPII_43730 [Osedax symbiont Rs1]